ncbi:uncharacterized protein LOC144905466 [Branchiostoma floridae x Branchiostoma belcheri]
MGMWNKAKSSKICWVLLGCVTLVIVSVVTAVVLSAYIQPGSKKAKDALKADNVFGLRLTNSSARASTIFYKENGSFEFLANTTPFRSPPMLRKSDTQCMATFEFMAENVIAASYSTSSLLSSKGESTEASTKASSSPGIEPMTTTPVSTTDINECYSEPCQHGRCVNQDGGYKCTCSPGWTGQNCQQDINECIRNPCHHGRCVNKDGGYKCTCSPGWTGQNCQHDINECARNPCKYGTCVNTHGGYICTCLLGWTGQNCQQDIDECTSKPCEHGTCVNKDGGYKCTCSPGWTGHNCQQDINECIRNQCHRGRCVNNDDINECSRPRKPCRHGTCVNKRGGYKCTCNPGWIGQRCQQDINECIRNLCQHGRCTSMSAPANPANMEPV